MSQIYDIAVIGAGSIGTSCAYYNAKKGADVILIDAGDIADSTSSRSDGNILVCDKQPGFDALFAKASQDMFPGLEKELDYNIEWTQKGSLYLTETEEEFEIASRFCSDMKQCGIEMRMLDHKEVLEDEPYLAKDIYGGLETISDGSVYPIGLAYAFALAAERLGAVLSLHNPVVDLKKEENYFSIFCENGTILAKNVVNACGVRAPLIGKMAGLDIPIRARQGQILVSEQTFRVARRKVHEFGYMLTKFQSGDYERPVSERVKRNEVAFVFEPTTSNNFLIGSSRSFVGEDIRSEIDVMQALAERAIRFFPVIAGIKVIRAYSGLRPFTPDHMPIVSGTAIPGFYIAAGHEGDGIGLSPITGKCMADIIAGEETFMDLSPLSFERFSN
ncbi:FAD-binding oxidoreductase [Clostridium sp. AF19-22AC]|jgi:glycine/D-amino acid oxidase-like deaminating enzyme|uniref:NAD(P)/FAD-dependent oxidoreductase n=1 Tax=Clostridia TaxID=186801 RepID=UPI000E4CF0B8|nr:MULTISPECIES: FAD-binding oxidoreductase [Clostridia]RHR22393.1 FAD-binding oxidoreductase [Clostridium sp. AF19-22AC]